MLRWSLQRLLERKNMTYFTPERRSIVCLQPMQFKIEIMSLSNFRSFLRGKFRSARGYLCLLHMIHINGFGVKKQPPIGSLSNICLALVKTVPLLAASMCDTMVSLSCSRCRWFSQPKIMVIEFDDVHVTFVTVNFEKKFLKSRYQVSGNAAGKIHCCDPSFTKSNWI